MKRKKAEVEEREASLDKEEKILEGIRDSLKGNTAVFRLVDHSLSPLASQTRLKYSTTRSR